jgi:hypothetical protein
MIVLDCLQGVFALIDGIAFAALHSKYSGTTALAFCSVKNILKNFQ